MSERKENGRETEKEKAKPPIREDNIFGQWPILDIDGNIVLCPSIAAAKHLAALYDVRDWPWLKKATKDVEEKARKKADDKLISKNLKNEEADEEERMSLLESAEREEMDDVEQLIARRSGVTGFFHDRRVMSSPRPYVVAV